MRRLADPKIILLIYVAVALVVSVHKLNMGQKECGGRPYPYYNNYVIFRSSAEHLLAHQDLYERHPDDHWDYFLYSPAFAFCATPLLALPDWAGLTLWNTLNAVILFMAIRSLPIPKAGMVLALWLTLKELMTSMQNSQSNGLVAALIILVCVFLERDRPELAALCVALSAFIKVFGIAAILLAAFYPGKRRFAASLALWSAALLLAPAIVIPPRELLAQYQSWFHLLSTQHDEVYGLSLMGWMHTWLGLEGHSSATVLVGACVMLVPPLFQPARHAERVRLVYLAALLMWVVVFNHKAESPSFVIAMSGVWIWYAISNRSRLDTSLAILAFVCTSLSQSDLFPRPLRQIFSAHQLKAMPCILLWGKLTLELVAARIYETASRPRVLALPQFAEASGDLRRAKAA